ncbi:MAG: NHL repeat-containing protein [Gallionella sp.]
MLQPWVELTGGQASLPSGVLRSDYILFQRPAAISVQGNDLYLVDEGLRRIFRFDRTLQTLTPFASSIPVESGTSVYAAQDMTVYITVPSLGKVAHFTRDGNVLPALVSRGRLARPIAVAVNEYDGNIFVVDALYNHIVEFTRLGSVVSIIEPRQARSISAIAVGQGAIYVIDNISNKVVMLNRDGSSREVIRAEFPEDPNSIAVSRDNLLFISDRYDDSVKVYKMTGFDKGLFLGKVGGLGEPGIERFNGIGSLAVEDEMLFVADSMNGRIQTLLINSSANVVGR